MMIRIVLLIAALSLPASAVGAGAQTPVTADSKAKVTRIFEVAEASKPTVASRTATREQLGKLSPSASDDYRVRYAYALAMIREHHYPEALAAVNALIKSHPKYLPGHRMRAWLLLALHKNLDALVELETLAKLLPQDDANREEEQEYLEAAQFMGTVIGYFEGPGKTMIREPVCAKYKTLLLARLTSKRREAFQEQSKAVASRFAEVMAGTEKVVAKSHEKKKQAVGEVEGQQVELSKARADAKDKAEKTVEQLRTEWKSLGNDLATAQNVYTQLSTQALVLQNQRSTVRSELHALENPTKDEKGKVPSSARDAYNQYAPALRAAIGALDSQILAAGISMNQLVQRGAMIEYRMMQLAIEGERVGEDFVLQDEVFGKKAKLLTAQQKRVEMTPERTAKLTEQQRAFQLYDDFSYESEKQRVLDSLASQ
jgi:hypothetical protein